MWILSQILSNGRDLVQKKKQGKRSLQERRGEGKYQDVGTGECFLQVVSTRTLLPGSGIWVIVFISAFLKVDVQDSGELINIQFLMQYVWGRSLKFWLSNKLPGDAGAAGLWTTLSNQDSLRILNSGEGVSAITSLPRVFDILSLHGHAHIHAHTWLAQQVEFMWAFALCLPFLSCTDSNLKKNLVRWWNWTRGKKILQTWILETRYNTNHNVNAVLVSEMVSHLKVFIEGQKWADEDFYILKMVSILSLWLGH